DASGRMASPGPSRREPSRPVRAAPRPPAAWEFPGALPDRRWAGDQAGEEATVRRLAVARRTARCRTGRARHSGRACLAWSSSAGATWDEGTTDARSDDDKRVA